MKILFVCMGNICRSPAAENIMRHLVDKNNIEDKENSIDVTCDSAGTLDYHSGQNPDHRMMKEGKRRGLSFTGKARHVDISDYYEFDMLIGMDNDNVAYLKTNCPEKDLLKKISIFTDYCKQQKVNGVPDPYYDGEEGFIYVTDLIFDGCKNLISKIKNN